MARTLFDVLISKSRTLYENMLEICQTWGRLPRKWTKVVKQKHFAIKTHNKSLNTPYFDIEEFTWRIFGLNKKIWKINNMIILRLLKISEVWLYSVRLKIPLFELTEESITLKEYPSGRPLFSSLAVQEEIPPLCCLLSLGEMKRIFLSLSIFTIKYLPKVKIGMSSTK